MSGQPSLEERLAGLESSVAQLTHFITSNMRPDLGSGALTGEGDDEGDESGPVTDEDQS